MANKQTMVQQSIYIPEELLEAIKQRASKRDWSLNKWIVHALSRITSGH